MIFKIKTDTYQTLLDLMLSTGLFLFLLWISMLLGRVFFNRQTILVETEPQVSRQTIDYLLKQAPGEGEVNLLFNPQELLSLQRLRVLIRDTQFLLAVISTVVLIVSISAIKFFRASVRRKYIEKIARYTMEVGFVLTVLAASLSPVFAWAYHRYLFPSWRLNLGSDHLLRLLYPIFLNELVLLLAITTLLAGGVVGILLVMDPDA